MSEDVKVEQSSGNVFKDVGFSDVEAEQALLKADLALEIYNIIEAQKLTQAKAGKILGVAPSDISRLKKGDFKRFSVERLFTLLNLLTVTLRFGLHRRKIDRDISELLRFKSFYHRLRRVKLNQSIMENVYDGD